MRNKYSVGIIDIDYRGIPLINKILTKLPNENIIYIAAHEKNPEICNEYIHFLFTNKCKIIIISSNTFASLYINTLEKYLNLPVINCIKENITSVLENTKNLCILSNKYILSQLDYKKEFFKYSLKNNILIINTDSLIDAIIKNHNDFIEKFFKTLPKDLDTIILGSSYLYFYEKYFKKYLKKINIINTNDILVKKLYQILRDRNLLNNNNNNRKIECFSKKITNTLKKNLNSKIQFPIDFYEFL